MKGVVKMTDKQLEQYAEYYGYYDTVDPYKYVYFDTSAKEDVSHQIDNCGIVKTLSVWDQEMWYQNNVVEARSKAAQKAVETKRKKKTATKK